MLLLIVPVSLWSCAIYALDRLNLVQSRREGFDPNFKRTITRLLSYRDLKVFSKLQLTCRSY